MLKLPALSSHSHKALIGVIGALLALAISNSVFNFWSDGPRVGGPQVTGNGNTIVINARTLDDVRLEDVPCRGDVYVAETGRGLFYRAILGDVVMTWTAGDARYAMTDGVNTAYPARDPVIDKCLEKRAVRAIN